MNFTLKAIGSVRVTENRCAIHLLKDFIPGLMHLDGFSHLHILWWAHLSDSEEAREKITAPNLFKKAPSVVGVFASRTPERPNPVMISTVKVEKLDRIKGIITVPFIDAENGTPVIDIKPCFPVERIKNCTTPSCYAHWPEWAEDAEHFNWKDEISFESL
jgi:tRNA (adenine37-N6)-methyltransferase